MALMSDLWEMSAFLPSRKRKRTEYSSGFSFRDLAIKKILNIVAARLRG